MILVINAPRTNPNTVICQAAKLDSDGEVFKVCCKMEKRGWVDLIQAPFRLQSVGGFLDLSAHHDDEVIF